MTIQPGSVPSSAGPDAHATSLGAEVLRGLTSRPKQLSPSLLYDERGSCLFDRICDLPEYYITRTETQILRRAAADLGSLLTQRTWLVELGSGSSLKTRLLLSALPDLAGYVPVDISSWHLAQASQGLSAAYPHLRVLPVCADFTRPFELPWRIAPDERVLVFFPGSTIGNFTPAQAHALLCGMRHLAGRNGGLLIGFDLVKDPWVLERAYNDSAGVTAAFNLNVLTRLNRELGTRFDVDAFRHEAPWVAAESRIEMHLVSRRRQQVVVLGERIEFAAGERLVTEHCHKYTPEGFAALSRAAGLRQVRSWTDARGWFEVEYLHGYNDS